MYQAKSNRFPVALLFAGVVLVCVLALAGVSRANAQEFDFGGDSSFDFGGGDSFDFGGGGSSFDFGGGESSFDFGGGDSFDFGGDSSFDFGGDPSYFDYGGTSEFDFGGSSPFDFGGGSSFDFGGDSAFDFGGSSPFDFGDQSAFDFGGDSAFDFGGDSGFDFGGECDYYYDDCYDDDFCGYDCEVFFEDGVRYSHSPSFAQRYPSFSTPRSFAQPSQPFRVTAPAFAQAPAPRSVSTPPVVVPPVQQPRQQPFAQAAASNVSNVTTNTCTGNSCNTSVNNIDNSINGSFNTTTLTPVSSVPPFYPIQYTPNLSCTITAAPSAIQNGQASLLSWTSYGASRAWISDGIGAVATQGSLVVRPNRSVSYVLTVSDNLGRSQSCQTYVSVSGVAPYVSLSQIPYTGLDFGLLGNMLYWGAILAFAGAGSYLVLYYLPTLKLWQAGKGGFALSKVSIPTLKRQAVAAATPAIFSGSVNTQARPVQTSEARAPEAPLRTTTEPKDVMTLVRSKNGNDAPRVVVTRS